EFTTITPNSTHNCASNLSAWIGGALRSEKRAGRW
ncbi:MAG: hypothetical protein ACI857_003426, partial [Arenicella sp.]